MNINAKRLLRPYIGLEKFLVFLFLSVSSHDSDHRNYSLPSNFATNVYVLFKSRCIVFGVHSPTSACIKVSQYITAYGGKFFKILSLCVWRDSGFRNFPIHLKFSTNIYVLCKISCMVFGVHHANRACTGIHKSISIHYKRWRETL